MSDQFIQLQTILHFKSPIGFLSYYLYRWDVHYSDGTIVDSVFDVENLTDDPTKLAASLLLSNLTDNLKSAIKPLVELCECILQQHTIFQEPLNDIFKNLDYITRMNTLYATAAATLLLYGDRKNAIRILAYLFGATNIVWRDGTSDIVTPYGVLEDDIQIYTRSFLGMENLLNTALSLINQNQIQTENDAAEVEKFLTEFLYLDKQQIHEIKQVAKRKNIAFNMKNLINDSLTICLPKDNQGMLHSMIYNKLCTAGSNDSCSTLWLMAHGHKMPECECDSSSIDNNLQKNNIKRVQMNDSLDDIPNDSSYDIPKDSLDNELKQNPKLEQFDPKLKCIMCNEKHTILFKPCNHLCTCENHSNLNQCPICKETIELRIRVI